MNRREVLSKALFSSFEFCADGFVDDTDDGQTSKLRLVSFKFWQKPSLRNHFRRFRTELSLSERIVSYLYHSRTNLSFTYINTFSKKLIWDRIESGGNELFLTISCSDENHM